MIFFFLNRVRVSNPQRLTYTQLGGLGRGVGGGEADEHRLERCLQKIIRLSFSWITTLTPLPLKTNLEFQSVVIGL